VPDASRALDVELLQELLWAYGPCGQEDAVRAICQRELECVVDETWVDPAGNLIGLIRSGEAGSSSAAVRVMAHMTSCRCLSSA
jgi:putative aminopeptidase FrvX